jgi:hypothetical protein
MTERASRYTVAGAAVPALPAGGGHPLHCGVRHRQTGNTMDKITTKTPNPKCRLFLKTDL